jgi:hypothetical protein
MYGTCYLCRAGKVLKGNDAEERLAGRPEKSEIARAGTARFWQRRYDPAALVT